LTQYFGPGSGKLKLTNYKSTTTGEAHINSKVTRIEAPSKNKLLWELPASTKPIFIIGDSYLSTMKNVKASVADKIQIISYPGGNFSHLYDIFKKQTKPIPKVDYLIMSTGINNRSQNAQSTANKKISSLYYQAHNTLPNAKLFYPSIGNNLSSTWEKQNLKYIEKDRRSFKTPPVTILPSISVIEMSRDDIHWTTRTAKNLLNQWLDYLPSNLSHKINGM
jgi:hypothetical protein